MTWTQDPLASGLGTRAHARRDDPSTSHDAAASVGDVRLSQRLVWELLADMGPSTDEEISRVAPLTGLVMSPSGLRTRRHELVDLGRVMATGQKRLMTTGRWAQVWEVVKP